MCFSALQCSALLSLYALLSLCCRSILSLYSAVPSPKACYTFFLNPFLLLSFYLFCFGR